LVKNHDPLSPKFRKAFGQEDTIKGLPCDGVKSFAEIQLENSSRGRTLVTGLNNVRNVDKVSAIERPEINPV
jgi:hypothetical protein